jgi:putative ABC transport system substrate-binding protein
MRRREFITLLGGTAATWPLAARAQEPHNAIRRVGIVMPYAANDAEYQTHVAALREGLQSRGWLDGRNIQFDVRWTTDDMDRIRSNAASLMAAKPDVVIAIGGRVIPVLMQLSKTIPIVVAGASDPVGTGWVQSIARPGGNVTGFTFLELPMFGKMLELLKQIEPSITRVVMIYNPDNPNTEFFRRAFAAGAGQLAVEPVAIPVHQSGDITEAIASAAGRRDSAILIPPDITLQARRTELVDLVTKSRIAAIYPQAIYVKIGGLMFYGADRIDLWRRAAEYVDRILHGESPAELPFQQPIKYQFIINLRAAKGLGLRIPQNLLATADEVIE